VTNLSPTSVRILRAVIAAMRPRGHGFDQPIDEDVLYEIDRALPCLPPLTHLGLRLGLRLLEWTAPLLAGRPTRFTRLGREEATRCLERCLASHVPGLPLLLRGLRALVFLAFYQHPTVLEAMGVEWDRRLAETARLRAETLDHAKYGYPR
jgi:hypothetical protein